MRKRRSGLHRGTRGDLALGFRAVAGLDLAGLYRLGIFGAFRSSCCAAGFDPEARRDLKWIASVNFKPEALFADAVLRKNPGNVVIVAKGRDPSIVFLHLHTWRVDFADFR